jgi:hypothetical protein
MARIIKPFDDSQQKDRRRSSTNSSNNTSGVDAYRQGVELTSPAHFANGIAKIHGGYNDQSGEHGVPELVLGQSKLARRDDNSFLDTIKFDPVARFYDPPATQVIIPSVPAFDPATLPLSLYLRNFTGAPWTSLASTGTSGDGRAFITEGGDPTVGAVFGGYTSADFNGAGST